MNRTMRHHATGHTLRVRAGFCWPILLTGGLYLAKRRDWWTLGAVVALGGAGAMAHPIVGLLVLAVAAAVYNDIERHLLSERGYLYTGPGVCVLCGDLHPDSVGDASDPDYLRGRLAHGLCLDDAAARDMIEQGAA